MKRKRAYLIVTLMLAGVWGVESHACSVCFGDPDSPMTHGVIMGIWVLIGVIGFVLTLVAGTGLYWLHRSRRLAAVPEPGAAASSHMNSHG